LAIAALVAAAVAALAAGIDGVRSGSLPLCALALDLSLAALACWWVLDAGDVRHKQSAAQLDPCEITVQSDGTTREDPEAASRIFSEARSMHFIFLTVPAVIVLALAAFRLWADFVGVSSPLTPSHATAVGVITLAVSCLWMLLSESFVTISAEELPEGSALALAFRDARWASLAVAVGMIGSQAVSGLEGWIGRALAVWVLAVSFEQALRGIIAWLVETNEARFITPAKLLIREAILVRGNPLASLFDTLEARFGLSFRSSWSIRFVRQATVPVLSLLGLLVWGFTGLAVVEVHQFGIEERFGRIVPVPLSPGLHVIGPWPFGRVRRFPVKTVSTMLIGYREEESAPKTLGPRAMLWTQAHAQEFALVLGTATELVAVNAVVSYKIHEDPERFLDYAYRAQNPAARLETYAYRCLREETQSATLASVLTEDRLAFARRIRSRLRKYADDQRLGLDVIDIGIISLHPPVEVASDYLDVINAGIDATRTIQQASGESQAKLQTAAGESEHLVAQAKIDAAKRLGQATGESAEFIAAAETFENAPGPTRSRLWFDAMEQILKDKRLFILDATLAREQGELLLDLRSPAAPATVPATVDPPVPTGAIVPSTPSVAPAPPVEPQK